MTAFLPQLFGRRRRFRGLFLLSTALALILLSALLSALSCLDGSLAPGSDCASGLGCLGKRLRSRAVGGAGDGLALSLPRFHGRLASTDKTKENEGGTNATTYIEPHEDGRETALPLNMSAGLSSLKAAELGAKVVDDGVLEVPLVELELEDFPWRIAKVFVPLVPEVAAWWTQLKTIDVSARLDSTLTGHARIHVEMRGSLPLRVGDEFIHTVRTVVYLPEDAVLKACHLGSVYVAADIPSLVELGPIRALLVVCPVRPSASARGAGGNNDMGNIAAETARRALGGTGPLRWLVLPWIVLMMPLIVGSAIGPAAVVGGACLTLASFASVSFMLALLAVAAQRRLSMCTQKWRRIWRLHKLARRPQKVETAYGDTGPCCICLGDPSPRDALIVVLPCRHTLHDECYRSWVRADAYPSHDLICPLCRRRTEAVGKLVE